MSTKIKASSKNKKATSKTITKKNVAKKPVAVKKATKTAAKAKPVKKSITKPKAVAKKVAAKKIAPKKAIAKKVAPKKAIAKKVVAKKAVVKQPVKKVTAKKVAKPAKKVVAKKVVAKKVVAKKAVAKKSVTKNIIKKAAPKKVIAKKVIAKKVAPKKVSEPIKKPIVKPYPHINSKKEVEPLHSKVSTIKEIKHIIEEVTEQKIEKAPKPAKVKKEKAPIIKKPIVAPTTFRKTDSSPTKFIKEPAGKFEMEFVIRASEDMVFEFVSSESGLSEWFCDDVNIRDGVFTFDWDGQVQQAKLVKEVPPMLIRYQWLDKNDGSYFEFKIQKDELTNDISLIITDFAADKADEVSAKLLWHSQIDKLLHVLGSFF